MIEGKIYIGTSGWNYQDWHGLFYPEKLSPKEYLKFYAEQFNTVEINSSFYHFPKNTTYRNWYYQVPEGFMFSVKVHRSITHIKKFVDIEKEWKKFIDGAMDLKEKLAVVLFQFPASFKFSEENFGRIENFFSGLTDIESRIRMAFEFRHISWNNEQINNLLKKYNICWVIANSSRYPEIEKITASFMYLRMHGPEKIFASEYSESYLKKLAEKIKIWKKGKDIFVYFNNDLYGYAVKNGKYLMELLR